MVTYMKVLEAYTNSVYENFRTQDYDYWSFGNQILYDMCLKNPSHTNENVIIGKIWLIGRSYAAAIERIKENRCHPMIFIRMLLHLIFAIWC